MVQPTDMEGEGQLARSTLLLGLCCAAVVAAPALAQQPALSADDQSAAFRAAGFTQRGGNWRSDCDDPGTPSYEPGAITQVGDLNGDGLPEALVTEGGTYCYGNTGSGFTLVSRQADGRWTALYQSQGLPNLLDSRVNGWPEIEVGGPGFCFPVLQWDGKAYAIGRQAYQGRPCRR